MSPPRIAFYLPHLRTGGVETVFVRLAREFARIGHDVRVVVDRAEGELAASLTCPVDILDAPRTLAAVPRLTRWLRVQAPDVLFSAISHNNLAALAARRLAGVPTAIIIGEHSILSRQTTKDWKFRLMPMLARLAYRRADAIVTVSEAGRNDLAALLGCSADVIDVMPNPATGPDAASRAAAAVTHPWFGAGDLVMAAGRLAAVKDFDLLLRAFALVASERPCRLIILGEGPERPRLERLCADLGLSDRVDLPGRVDDTLPWFAHARAVVMSSHYEGFGLVLVEAMACGTPVVTTASGGPPAEILGHGAFGPVAASRTPGALAAAIIQAFDHPVSPDVLRRRAADFSTGASIAAYEALITRVLSANRKPGLARAASLP